MPNHCLTQRYRGAASNSDTRVETSDVEFNNAKLTILYSRGLKLKLLGGPHEDLQSNPRAASSEIYFKTIKNVNKSQYNKNIGLYNWYLIHLLIVGLMFNVDVMALLGLRF